MYEQIDTAHEVLAEINIRQKDTLLVINEIDALPDRGPAGRPVRRCPSTITIGGQSGVGLRQLAAAVSDALSRHFFDVNVEMGVDNGRLLAYLAITRRDRLEDLFPRRREVSVHCRISAHLLGRLHAEGVRHTLQSPSGQRARERGGGSDGRAWRAGQIKDRNPQPLLSYHVQTCNSRNRTW